MLNNADSVLKKGDVKEAIEDYQDLFEGARTEVTLDTVCGTRRPLCNCRSNLSTSRDFPGFIRVVT